MFDVTGAGSVVSRLLSISVLSALAALSPAGAKASDVHFREVSTTKLLSLNGAWISRGYGLVWYVANGGVTEFQLAGAYCFKVGRNEGLPDSASTDMHLADTSGIMRLGVDDGIGYLHTFDRHPALPGACLEKLDPSPAGVFDAVDQIFSHRYAFFGLRGLDWANLVRSHRARITPGMSDQALFTTITDLLSHLGDEHVSLTGMVGGEQKRYTAPGKPPASAAPPAALPSLAGTWVPDAALQLLGRDARSNDSGVIVYGFVAPRVGYLHFKSFSSRRLRDLDATLDDAMALFRAADAVIVDVSHNGGGGEDLGKRVAQRFAAQRTLALSKYAGDVKGGTPQAIHLEPGSGPHFHGPAFVITSSQTFSAAETTAMYLRVLANVTHVGEPTAGALSDVLERWLPNGWKVGLSNEVYLDADGQAWEAIGVPPHLRLDVRHVDGKVSPEHLETTRRVIETLRMRALRRAASDQTPPERPGLPVSR